MGETDYSTKWLTSCSPIEWIVANLIFQSQPGWKNVCLREDVYNSVFFFYEEWCWKVLISVCTSHPWPLPLGFSGYYYRLLYELSDPTPREMKARLCYWHCYPLPQAKSSLFCSYITGPQQLGYLWRWGCCSLQNFYFSFKEKSPIWSWEFLQLQFFFLSYSTVIYKIWFSQPVKIKFDLPSSFLPKAIYWHSVLLRLGRQRGQMIKTQAGSLATYDYIFLVELRHLLNMDLSSVLEWWSSLMKAGVCKS